jgi:hypothetical protein
MEKFLATTINQGWQWYKAQPTPAQKKVQVAGLLAIAAIIWAPISATSNRHSASNAVATPSRQPAQAQYLATSPQGYELWKEGNCMVVKGATVRNIDALKQQIKQSSGYDCVLFH